MKRAIVTTLVYNVATTALLASAAVAQESSQKTPVDISGISITVPVFITAAIFIIACTWVAAVAFLTMFFRVRSLEKEVHKLTDEEHPRRENDSDGD